MSTQLTIGIALTTPALAATTIAAAIWAKNNPKEFAERLVIAAAIAAAISLIAGISIIAAIWWPWWALPAALAAIAFFIIMSTC